MSANALAPLGHAVGLDGVILLAYIIAIPANEIVILAPFMSDALRFSLIERLRENGVAARSHRPSRALRDEPLGDAQPDAAAGPGDDRDPAGQAASGNGPGLCVVNGCHVDRSSISAPQVQILWTAVSAVNGAPQPKGPAPWPRP